MTHHAVVEAGPAAIRRRCCDATESADAAVALEWIDDPVALVDGQPIAVPELLRGVLACPMAAESVEVIHPSWWPARRVELIVTSARSVTGDVVTRPRSAVLSGAFHAAAVVEIAAALVAVTGIATREITAEPRIGPPREVVAAVVRRVLAALRDHPATVVIDAPVGVGGADAVATMIAARLRGEVEVVIVDELPVRRAVAAVEEPVGEPTRNKSRTRWPLAAAAALAVVAVGLRAHPPPDTVIPSTYLVEGRVAVQVPVDWPARRVAGGPGSARVEVTSPGDPQLVLHLTQALAAGDTLLAVAEPLRQAVDLAETETPGVFVGFDPAGASAGRPAVTYREVRDGHHVDWAVLVDHAVRIGIGCQSGPGGDDVLRPVCEQAVRSAHAVG